MSMYIICVYIYIYIYVFIYIYIRVYIYIIAFKKRKENIFYSSGAPKVAEHNSNFTMVHEMLITIMRF